jgi:hypothetical protein
MMKYVSVLVVLAFSFAFFSCKEPATTYDDEAAVVSTTLNQTNEDVNNSEAAIQLAQLPEPDGTPILVGIDKSFWVKDSTDPTPFINVVNLFSHIYLKSDSSYGVWLYTDTGWERRSSDTNRVTLIWVKSDTTFELTLHVDSTNGMTSYIHVLKGSIDLFKNVNLLFVAVFSNKGDTVDVDYYIAKVASFNVHAIRTSVSNASMFVGTINGTVYKESSSSCDSILVNATCKSDSTRSVEVIYPYKNTTFKIVSLISKIQSLQGGPRYRDITGNFFANNLDIGDVVGRKYEYQDSAHRDYLKIILNSGRTLYLW